MEKAFELAEVKDDKKAQYASYYLKDEAMRIFEGVAGRKGLNMGEVYWNVSGEIFANLYARSVEDEISGP